jgi:hypothetical protein
MCRRLVLCLWALALAGGCGRGTTTTATVTLRIDEEAFRPEYVLLQWRQINGREIFRDVRLPDRGLLARQGAVLGSVEFQIETDLPGDRELRVSGVRDHERVAGATARIAWVSGRNQRVTLTLGCADDLEQADAIAACAQVDPEAMPLPTTTDAGVDAARDTLVRPPDPPAGNPHGMDAGVTNPLDAGPDRPAAPEGGAAAPDAAAAADAGVASDVRLPPRDGPADDQRTVVPHAAPAGIDLERGLLLYLRLDEGMPGVASLRDGSGRQNQTTLVDPDAAITWITGPLGGAAVAFPSTATAWLSVTSSPALNEIRAGLTIAAWVRAPAVAGNDRRTIAARRSIGPGGYLYSLHLIGNRPGLYIHSSNGANANLVSPVAVSPGTWVHLALVYDLTSARVMIDGQLVAEQGFQLGIGPENSPLSLGASEDVLPNRASDPLGGDLDEVVVYDRALGPAEIEALVAGAQPAQR